MRFFKSIVLSTLATGCVFCAAPSVSWADPSSQKAQAKAKQNQADLNADSNTDREVVQALEHVKKQLENEKHKDGSGHRAAAIDYIQKAMGEIRSRTSKPGH